MAKKKTTKKKEDVCCFDVKSKGYHKSCGGTYFLGFLGAAIYYVSTATGFWNGVLGIVKAIVWPAFLIFEVLKFIGA